MSWENTERQNQLAARLREVLKEHQRDGLSMIGNVDRLVYSLVLAVQGWIEDEQAAEKKKSA